MGNPVVHWEFMSKDPQNVSDFYAKLFGWKIQHMGGPVDYRLVDTGAKGEMRGINGGILKPDREGPCNMLFYVLVDDLGAYRKKIVEAGGVIHVEEQEGPGLGWFSFFTDPEGRRNGRWKGRAAKRGARKTAEKAGKRREKT